MLTLVNTNTMAPPIAPIGLDYIAQTTRAAGIETDIVDLALAEEPDRTLRDYFGSHSPELVGISFRNVDDCFWPSAQWFVPDLIETVNAIRRLTDAPIVVGGVGFSIFAKRIVEDTGADFGIRGDGEQAVQTLLHELRADRRFEHIDGLIWRRDGQIVANRPAWPSPLRLPTGRDAVDNLTYFKKAGQVGLETKRGCCRKCAYCADPLAKGRRSRLRDPKEVANEAQSLLEKGIDVLHLCDCEFNIPVRHAIAVCREFIRRGLGDNLRWYTYMTVTPFTPRLAELMARAGCVGIDFTGDSANSSMLNIYRQPHTGQDLAAAVRLCRANKIKVMIDLLLGGPGETIQTCAETIDFIKHIEPDCAGASLGIRIYPGTEMSEIVASQGPLRDNPNLKRKYTGPIDFFRPTFYISAALGPSPAESVRGLIDGDSRFFEPMSEITDEKDRPTDHNYNDNADLIAAIKKGARGAYWDILHELRS